MPRARQNPNKVPEFIVDFGWGTDGLGDVLAEELAESFPQAVDGNLDGTFAHSEVARGVRLVEGVGVADEPGFHPVLGHLK